MVQAKKTVEFKEMEEIASKVKGLSYLSGILSLTVVIYLTLRLFNPDFWGMVGMTGIILLAFASVLLTLAQFKTVKFIEHISWGKIENLAFRDELTGVYNYRYIEKRLKKELERVKKFSVPLSLIYIDIDHFKKVNDNWGHEAGNMILKTMGDFFHILVRDNDLVGRVGGDEFILILPFTPLDQALPIADRIRDKIKNHVFNLPGNEKVDFLQLSMGVVSTPSLPPDKNILIREADEAMYRAKIEGGNQVSL